jgi:hypothetical protein
MPTKENEDSNMEEQKIRELLKKYGVDEDKIDNFMEELLDIKEDLDIDKEEESNEEFLLNADNRAKLKLTKEGQDLIINAPKMAKEELAEAIKKLLTE